MVLQPILPKRLVKSEKRMSVVECARSGRPAGGPGAAVPVTSALEGLICPLNLFKSLLRRFGVVRIHIRVATFNQSSVGAFNGPIIGIRGNTQYLKRTSDSYRSLFGISHLYPKARIIPPDQSGLYRVQVPGTGHPPATGRRRSPWRPRPPGRRTPYRSARRTGGNWSWAAI